MQEARASGLQSNYGVLPGRISRRCMGAFESLIKHHTLNAMIWIPAVP